MSDDGVIEIDLEKVAAQDPYKATHYQPSAWGAMFHALPHREALGAGSAGPGKSLVLLMDPIQRIMLDEWRCQGFVPESHRTPELQKIVEMFPLRRGESTGWALHLRRAMPMLSQTIARSLRIFPRIDPGARFDKNTSTWYFSSGYRYQFGHCLNRDDWQKYDSSEFDWIGYDELVQFEEEQYHNINSRLRSIDPIHRKWLKIRAMSNPVRKQDASINVSVRDPHWVRRRFVDPYPEGGVTLRRVIRRNSDNTDVYRDRIFLRATLYDNPDKEFVRRYEEELLDKPLHIRKAMLEGNWYITPDSFFGADFSYERHVIAPFPIPEDMPAFRAMDWGFKTQGVVGWFVMDHDDNLIMIREFNFRMMEARDVALRIAEIEKSLGMWVGGVSAITGPADTQIWEMRGESGRSKAEEMAAVGVGWVPADKKSRQRNAERIIQRLRDVRGGLPSLMFFAGLCPKTVQTLPAIQSDPNNSEEPQKGGEDHWWETLGYACAFASHGAKGIPRRRRHKNDRALGVVDNDPNAARRIAYGVYR